MSKVIRVKACRECPRQGVVAGLAYPVCYRMSYEPPDYDEVEIHLTDSELIDNGCPLEDAPEWIGVDDRLPREQVDVLVWARGCTRSHIMYLRDGDWVCKEGERSVTHWQPLPKGVEG